MSDLQHAETGAMTGFTRASGGDNIWRRTVIAGDDTHHLLDGRPAYASRFHRVGKYHAPGLAPVADDCGAYHINEGGHAAYSMRFIEAWGFYEGIASVRDPTGWLHIHPDGQPIYSHRFAWCGNFQEGRCTVRDAVGLYHHINIAGAPAYEPRHLYAGDYRDGAAVVRYVDDGMCGHVDCNGMTIHGERFLDLDVFHKGFARARDDRGWFHVDRTGCGAYAERFAGIEPFYNGQALCETSSGERVIIDHVGTILIRIQLRR